LQRRATLRSLTRVQQFRKRSLDRVREVMGSNPAAPTFLQKLPIARTCGKIILFIFSPMLCALSADSAI
jgi:hypothetical protein